MMKEVAELVCLSKQVGQRFDMVQAGGGNTSVKCFDGKMLIKASGIGLSEVEPDKGFSVVEHGVVCNGVRPSMEVGMHALLGKWVLHTHPLVVSAIVCCCNWKEKLKPLFPDALLINYYAPGEELAAALFKERERLKVLPEIIFLQNHGLVVHGDGAREVFQKTEDILTRFESLLMLDFGRYKLTTRIADLVRQQVSAFNGITYLSEDSVLRLFIREVQEGTACMPDAFIYGGYESVVPVTLEDSSAVAKYVAIYKTYPRVVVYQDNIFFLAPSVRKAQEAEAAVKAQVISLACGEGMINPLALSDLNFLAAMSAEQYRQNC